MLSNNKNTFGNLSGINDNGLKDFKTITLRGLDDKPAIVKIMNDVMKKQEIKTGQAIIEFIIADYAKTKAELETQRQKAKNFSDNHYKVVEQLEAENSKLKAFIQSIQAAFKSLTSFKL